MTKTTNKQDSLEVVLRDLVVQLELIVKELKILNQPYIIKQQKGFRDPVYKVSEEC